MATTSQELAETALQPSLFGEDHGLTPDSLGHGEHRMLADYALSGAVVVPAVRRLLVFPHVDEAQFFAKVWFAPVMAALSPGVQLFLAADPTQGFLKRRQSWLAADHTRLFYMAATRAARRLVVVTSSTGLSDRLLAIGGRLLEDVPGRESSAVDGSTK